MRLPRDGLGNIGTSQPSLKARALIRGIYRTWRRSRLQVTIPTAIAGGLAWDAEDLLQRSGGAPMDYAGYVPGFAGTHVPVPG